MTSDDEFDDDFGDIDISALEAAAVQNPKTSFKRPREADDDDNAQRAKTTKTEVPHTRLLARRVLQERFGLDEFRLKQELAITRLLDGGSSVVVFPTGAGKSLCYQVPAVAFKELDKEALHGSRAPEHSGVTLVISPLIALMKDQVDALLRRKIKAAVLNSSISREQYLMTQDDLRHGRLDLVYCAPERLNSEGAIDSLKAIPGGIRLLAVDEAHCISEWGHSFRPDYLKIARFAKEANVERVVCLTATATPKVAQDICDAFDIPPEGLFSTTVYRPNLRLLAQSSTKETDDLAKLVTYLRSNPGPTIIYVTVQKQTEKLAKDLAGNGFVAKPYHAGMNNDLRTQTQEQFIASESLVVVATIAFGMGIDKSNVRNIIHFDIPSSIESYSQQIGRAGRDGLPSTCLFNLSTKDFHMRNVFTYGDRPSARSLRLLLSDICSTKRKHLKAGDTFSVALYQQSKEVDIGAITLGIIYAQLELHFHLFRAAGTQYSIYKYETKNAGLIASDKSAEARVIGKPSNRTKWTTVPLDSLALSSGIERKSLVRKLEDWNDRGAVQLKKEGVLNTFRLAKPLPTTKKEIDDIVKHLDTEMEAKELQNIQRTKDLINLITDRKCFARALAEYFGELPGSDGMREECGHCTWCETHEQVVLPDEPPQTPDPDMVKKVLAACSIRDDPRFLAKLAFGIKSPRMAAEGLYKSPVFESANGCDFLDLVKVFTKHCPSTV
ncbi:ATP-dependent DNA helicase [Pleomassaria siparia CBS 279.74]|uniref:ATP-dependent DNA helicase n=1 Tax=Pleomassaria siparia CBS 279.74 TaxID=1314801 RepID=A0A6G1JYB2_9PLEO|nr:ATP-dependent DNA helicase [Pleomassaria siparia CBS 279.74]